MTQSKWQFWIDRGGTFTDIVAKNPTGKIDTHKLLSVSPEQYTDASIAGIKYFLGLKPNDKINPKLIDSVRMGTTVATNALLERKGIPVTLITSKGFKDCIRIAYQVRPELFNLHIKLPEMLYQNVIEAPERIDKNGQDLIEFDHVTLKQNLTHAFKQGARSLAIVFMHSYLHPTHEKIVGEIAQEIGFEQISLSHEVSPLIKLIGRGDTSLVEAYLSPILKSYLSSIKNELPGVDVKFMQSSGGLVNTDFFRAKDSILSGPAGGIVGATKVAQAVNLNHIVTFDMGGTSTDVAHYSGEYERSYETLIAGVRMRVPMMDIHTIAAGGGSIINFHQSRLQVGPESAGSHPGPACYRLGGPLTVTDCNVMLGKIQPQYFPSVFGKSSTETLDTKIVLEKFSALTKKINKVSHQDLSVHEIAEGFLQIAVENMVNAIKKISVRKGHDILTHALCCFGGAAGQHACAVADNLGVKSILIHPMAGVLSAYGMGLADMSISKSKMISATLDEFFKKLPKYFKDLDKKAVDGLTEQNVPKQIIHSKFYLHCRYLGTDSVIIIPFKNNHDKNTIIKYFFKQHLNLFGFMLENKAIEIEMISVEATSQISNDVDNLSISASREKPEAINHVKVYIQQKMRSIPVFERKSLTSNQVINGPAMIVEKIGTNLVDPDWIATVHQNGSLILTHKHISNDKTVEDKEIQVNPIMLEIFNSLFMSIAEDMGETLCNTAYSVNIKERKDFSCALFDTQGKLIANAPHVPIHLGSMSASVEEIIKQRKDTMKPGDAYALNDPYHGGTHLPDLTVITPIFCGQSKPIFYVGSRGHHADLGGISPGSMPANSKTIEEEGVLFTNFHLVKSGIFDEDAFVNHLLSATYPARNVTQNIGDVQAQIAANQKGLNEIEKMVKHFGQNEVLAYTKHVQDNAEEAVRNLLLQLKPGKFVNDMDIGCKISVKISIDKDKREAIIDFSGTSNQGHHNFNAPKSITTAAVLYVIRCLVKQNIPLNFGCLKPIKIIIPTGSLLDPTYPAAVVAGNVETSQVIVDAIFSALGEISQSQGTTNSFTYGNQSHQYYESLAGGSGAGPNFHGASGVQTHITNTPLTDPEILESRFPVILEEFSLRKNSGGKGEYNGGNGTIRKTKFLEPVTANILSNNRIRGPYGLDDGSSGQPGKNYIIRSGGKIDHLKGSDQAELDNGDIFVIESPGGGAYGKA